MIGTTPGVIKVPKGAVFIRVKKEQLQANKSRYSLKKSDRERILLITLYKRATLSKSLSISLKRTTSVIRS